MVISKCYNSAPSRSWMVNIYKYITDWGNLHISLLGLPCKVSQTTWFKTTELYCLIVTESSLESRSPRLRYWQSWFLFGVSEGDPSLATS